MPTTVEIKLPPASLHDPAALRTAVSRKARVPETELGELSISRRSIDARSSRPVFRLRVDIAGTEDPTTTPPPVQLPDVADAPTVAVIGCGPAGMFAALELIELGLKPVIIERGKDVRARRRSLRAIQQFGEVDPDSNYCFGEGGAGTYSDGKLYTRSLKRGNYLKALQTLVDHGAQEDILIDAHPHIGSNKLPEVVGRMRQTIIDHGGEIRFGHRVTDLEYAEDLRALVVTDTEGSQYRLTASAYILATGHSARDIYYLLHQHKLQLVAKPFALGVRIEHPQPLIDKIQYGQAQREENLPASSYKLVTQVKGRGVFSFCMCPGGLVVPAATAPGEIVVNGMSLSRRDSPYANSGTVVAVEVADLASFAEHGVFAGLALQQSVERAMFAGNADGSQRAPAQRLTDFATGKLSRDLPDTSYIPGLHPAPLHELLPRGIYSRLQQGVKDFGKKMRGYYTAEANVIGTESRTSSPVRIPRDRHTLQHPQAASLFPCGEGAGFAGGILSAAMDGQNVARAVAAKVRA